MGLSDALNLVGKKAIACLREPSLGPCFGMKGGATGGGHAQVVPGRCAGRGWIRRTQSRNEGLQGWTSAGSCTVL